MKMLDAKDIVKKPEVIDEIKGNYEIISDSTQTGTLNNMNQAINLMSQKGWRCVGMPIAAQAGSLTGYRIVAFALMERKE